MKHISSIVVMRMKKRMEKKNRNHPHTGLFLLAVLLFALILLPAQVQAKGNTKVTATKAATGKSYTTTWQSDGFTDSTLFNYDYYYKVSIPSPGFLTLTVNAPTFHIPQAAFAPDGGLFVKMYGKDGSTYMPAYYQPSVDKKGTQSFRISVDKGTWYFMLRPYGLNYRSSWGSGTMSVKWQADFKADAGALPYSESRSCNQSIRLNHWYRIAGSYTYCNVPVKANHTYELWIKNWSSLEENGLNWQLAESSSFYYIGSDMGKMRTNSNGTGILTFTPKTTRNQNFNIAHSIYATDDVEHRTIVEFGIFDVSAGKTGSIQKDASKNQYKIISAASKKAAFYRPASKNIKAITIPSTVTLNGVKYTVTSIASSAFSGCKNLKTITIKATSLSRIGSNAFKNIYKNAVFKVPKAKYSAYKKKLTAKTGFYANTMKIKKF